MKRLFLPLLALMFTLACNISVQLTDVPPTPPPPLATVPVEPPVEPTPTQVAHMRQLKRTLGKTTVGRYNRGLKAKPMMIKE